MSSGAISTTEARKQLFMLLSMLRPLPATKRAWPLPRNKTGPHRDGKAQASHYLIRLEYFFSGRQSTRLRPIRVAHQVSDGRNYVDGGGRACTLEANAHHSQLPN